jgi:hypothetical protein
MDRLLSNKDKDNDVGKKDGVSTLSPAVPSAVPDANTLNTTVGAYSPELSYKNWEDSQKNLRWDSTPQGRAVIRLFSRGFLGSVGFAAGSWYIGRGGGMTGYSPNMKLSEIPYKPLQYIAKSIDTVVGKPIKFTAEMLGKSPEAAEEWVRFRPTRNFNEQGIIKKGRSLGHEAVVITFDFFCASVFDAFGRDIANMLDSHVKHDWKDEKGNIDYKKAFKEAGKSVWRYVSYNGGEDWAVSVPYAFFLRGQRNVIDKHFSKGFGYDSDRALNGGSFKVDKDSNVIGNYNLAGMADLQGRFTVYNIGTLMYREAYNHIANKIQGIDTTLYGSVSDKKDKKQTIGEKIGEMFKWVVRSILKGGFYMTTAVPFFHIFRTPQSSYKGLFINPEDNSVLGFKNGEKYDALHAHEAKRFDLKFKRGADGNFPEVNFRRREKNGLGFETVGRAVTNEYATTGKYEAYKQTVGNPVLNAIGRGQDKIRNGFSDFVVDKFGASSRRNSNTFIGSAMSYTPYMYAKGEAARLWDDGRMDAALERTIDGAVKFDYREFKAGASEVWHSIMKQPFADQKREEYAIKRIREDESPADNLTKEQAYLDQIHDIAQSPLSWKERIIHGRPAEKVSEDKQFEKHASYADQEAMRKALAELQPPTNSVH